MCGVVVSVDPLFGERGAVEKSGLVYIVRLKVKLFLSSYDFIVYLHSSIDCVYWPILSLV